MKHLWILCVLFSVEAQALSLTRTVVDSQSHSEMKIDSQSLNCQFEKQSVLEGFICQSPQLVALDSELTRIHADVYALPESKFLTNKIQRQQNLWMEQRVERCPMADSNELTNCLVDDYQKRISALSLLGENIRESTAVVKTKNASYPIEKVSFSYTDSDNDDGKLSCSTRVFLNRDQLNKFLKFDIESIFDQSKIGSIKNSSFRNYFEPEAASLIESCDQLQVAMPSIRSVRFYREELLFVNKNVLSIDFHNWDWEGGAHGFGGSTVLNLDLNTKTEITWTDLFGLDSAKIDGYVYQQVVENLVYPGYLGEDFSAIYQFKNYFSFNPQGLVITYPVYEIAPYSEGERKLTVPYTLLKTYMSPENYRYYFGDDSVVLQSSSGH